MDRIIYSDLIRHDLPEYCDRPKEYDNSIRIVNASPGMIELQIRSHCSPISKETARSGKPQSVVLHCCMGRSALQQIIRTLQQAMVEII